MSQKLNKAQLAELKDLYIKDSPKSVREMAKHFNVGINCIKWAVNYKNYREKQIERNLKWQKENPAWHRTLQKRAIEKYQKTEKFKETRRRYYLRNREKILDKMKKWHKKYYWKNREKILARDRERYKMKRSLNN